MNRKKLMAMVAAVVVLIAVIALAVQPKQREKQPEDNETELAEMKYTAEESVDPMTVHNNENQEGSAENTEEKGTVENDREKVDNTAGHNMGNQTEETKSLIPEENVQLGVEEMEFDPDLEGSAIVEGSQSTNDHDHDYAPTQPKQEATTEEQELPADFEITKLTYEQYNAMSGAQQRQVIEMFASVEEFMKWYRAVEAKYQAEHPDIEIGADGVINAEDLIK